MLCRLLWLFLVSKSTWYDQEICFVAIYVPECALPAAGIFSAVVSAAVDGSESVLSAASAVSVLSPVNGFENEMLGYASSHVKPVYRDGTCVRVE